MFGIMRDSNNSRKRREEEEVRRASARPLRPTTTKEMLEAAFVRGAAWWEWHKEGATMWQSDQNLAWEEAQRKDWTKLRGPDGQIIK